ncbi:MAG: SDR family oxidoreductase [Verrucomicrobia bacterium]|nr:SDR family oxidoreductase [Cytophagales bacterium]
MSQTIVITGGSKGIGKALVVAFAGAGFDVITCSRNPEDLQKLKTDLTKNYPNVNLHTFSADLSKKQEVIAFADFVKQTISKVDVLINNTGYFLPGQIHNEAEGTLESMLATNVHAAYHLTRLLLPDMMSRQTGHIFNICSTASITPYTNGGSYCISKFALYGMTQVLREELKPHGIKVTAVLPGATLTASWEGTDLPESRFMKAEDIAKTILAAYQLSANTVIEEILLRPQLGDI